MAGKTSSLTSLTWRRDSTTGSVLVGQLKHLHLDRLTRGQRRGVLECGLYYGNWPAVDYAKGERNERSGRASLDRTIFNSASWPKATE